MCFDLGLMKEMEILISKREGKRDSHEWDHGNRQRRVLG